VIFEFFCIEFQVPLADVAVQVDIGRWGGGTPVYKRLDAFVAEHLSVEVTAAAVKELPLAQREELHRLVCYALGARITWYGDAGGAHAELEQPADAAPQPVSELRPK
jgi:hypothetical protein